MWPSVSRPASIDYLAGTDDTAHDWLAAQMLAYAANGQPTLAMIATTNPD